MNFTKRIHNLTSITRSARYCALLLLALLCSATHVFSSYAQAQAQNFAQTHPVRVAVVLPLKSQLSEGARSLEFYRGLLLAAEDAKKMGYTIQISAFNEDLPETDITPTLEKAAAQSDVLLGFFYRNHIIAAGSYCEKSGRLAAFPMSNYIPIDLKNNRSCIFTATTAKQFVEKYAKIATSTFGKCNIIYAHSASAQSVSEMDDFAREMKSSGCKVHDINADAAPQAIKKQMTSSRQNIIITNSSDANELNVLLSNVKRVSVVHPDYPLTVLGNSQWASFCNTPDVFMHNDVYVPILANPNTSQPAAEALRARYQEAFHCAPMNRTPSELLDGYDFGMMLFEGMSKYGTSFMLYPSTCPHIVNAYSFSNPNNGCWTNENVRLLHFTTDGLQYLLEFKNK